MLRLLSIACLCLLASTSVNAGARKTEPQIQKRAHKNYVAAIEAIRAGNIEKGRVLLDNALRLDPGNIAALTAQELLRQHDSQQKVAEGNRQLASNERDKAVDSFRQALTLDASNAGVYSNRGAAWREKGDLDRAIADLDRAIQLQPDYARAFHHRALTWERKSDADRAMADYDQAIRLEPGMTAALMQRGILHERRGDLERARADLSAATTAPPKYFGDPRAQQTAREHLTRIGIAAKPQ